jgi:hypothetical protein
MKNINQYNSKQITIGLINLNVKSISSKILVFFLPLLFIFNSHSQVGDCIDFTNFPLNDCDTFYISNNSTQSIYTGCVNVGDSNYHNPGIYGTGNILDFNFNGSNQQILVEGYGFLGQFGAMGYSINGGPTFYMDTTFPIVSNGVGVFLQMTGQSTNNFDNYILTFMGPISTLSHQSFESGILEICALEFSNTEECVDFSDYPLNYCDSFYLATNPNQYLYEGCINEGSASYSHNGIYGSDSMNLNFNGQNQEVIIEGYGIIGQFGAMGYSINGGSIFYLDTVFPIVSNGITVDFQMTGPASNSFEDYEITFSGPISTIMHKAFESGIETVCVEEELLSSTNNVKNTIELEIYPNPATDRIYIKSDHAFETAAIVAMNGQKTNAVINKDKSIDVSNLNSGIYILNLFTNDKMITKKFIIR